MESKVRKILAIDDNEDNLKERLEKLVLDRTHELELELGIRKKAEKELQETLIKLKQSEERFRYISSSISDISYSCRSDDEGDYYIDWIYGATEKMTGYTVAELIEMKCWGHIVVEDDESLFNAHVRDLQPGTMDKCQVRLKHKNGNIIWIEATAECLTKREDNGRTYLYGGIVDISERKRAEEDIQLLNAGLERRVKERTLQLELAIKEIESFSYSVSHDLRAPLRGIDGWSLALLEDYGEIMDEKAKIYLNRVRAETQKMGQLIDDLLQLSRISRSEMVCNEIDLSKLVIDVTERMKLEQPERNVTILINNGITGKGDPLLLELVLTNLLHNAWKFTGKRSGAKIEFGSIIKENQTVYFVRDNGAGFDMAYAKKLFGAFQRLHKSSDFPGTGIGLATVQRIIHRHEGMVWAESEEGIGSTFFFTLKAQ